MSQDVPSHDPDFSELLVFHVGLLEELGDLRHALEFLDSKGNFIVDRTAILTFRGSSPLFRQL